jgi:hypothetical protein
MTFPSYKNISMQIKFYHLVSHREGEERERERERGRMARKREG